MKINKFVIGGIIVISFVLIILCYYYMTFLRLDVYTVTQSGDIISKNGIVYKFDGELTSSYLGGDLKSGKAIGRISGEGYWGRRIYKVKGLDSKVSIAIEGEMLQEVHTTESKQ